MKEVGFYISLNTLSMKEMEIKAKMQVKFYP